MGLKSLLEMDKNEMESLKDFVKDETLNIGVHTGFAILYTPHIQYDRNDESYVDFFIKEIERTMGEIPSYDGTPDPIGEFNSPTGSVLRHLYMETMQDFVRIVDSLNEKTFIDNLIQNDELLMFLMPNNFLETSEAGFEYMQYLAGVTSNDYSHPYLMTELYNSGDLQRPLWTDHKDDKFPKSKLTDTKKLDKLNEMFEVVGIKNVNLFGGNIYQCLHGAERSLRYTDVENVNIVLDAAAVPPTAIISSVYVPEPQKRMIKRHFANGYQEVKAKINEVLTSELDFTDLIASHGKGIEKQYEVIQQYKPLIDNLNWMKESLATGRHESIIYRKDIGK